MRWTASAWGSAGKTPPAYEDISRMPRYSPGKRVSQDQYGPGTIVECNERHTLIRFDDHGVRLFVTTIVDLNPSTLPEPSKAKRTKAGRKR